MTRRLVYLESSADDLEDIADFIAEQSGEPAIAAAQVARLQQRCERLADLPGVLGQSRNELLANLRSTPEGSFVIFFRYAEDRVEIVSILHAARDLDAFFETARN